MGKKLTSDKPDSEPGVSISIGEATITPGTRHRLEVPVARLPTQTPIALPVTVINGVESGPRLWISAAIHGDEINGVEIIRQVLLAVNPLTLRGTLIAVPIVNVFGFIEQSRYLPDRRDLNRSFPGSSRGSLAARLAHLFMKEIVSQCHYGIDLHTASHHRVNYPQIRANLKNPEAHRCARAFGTPLVIHAATRDGSLRQAAARQGIPVLLYEGGEALRFDTDAIQVGVEGILRVMNTLGMGNLQRSNPARPPLEVWKTRWVRAVHGGILHMTVEIGEPVRRKQCLGFITDAFGDHCTDVLAPCEGIIIGATRNPLINQGNGIFHIAVLDGSKLLYI